MSKFLIYCFNCHEYYYADYKIANCPICDIANIKKVFV
jgi:hypothetical protein